MPQYALLYEESGEAVEFLLQTSVVLGGYVCDEALWCIGRVSGIEATVLHVGEPAVKLLAGDAQRTAEVEGVECLYVLGIIITS